MTTPKPTLAEQREFLGDLAMSPTTSDADEKRLRVVIATLRRVEKLEVILEAARESTCCSEHAISGHTCGRKPLADALAALDQESDR